MSTSSLAILDCGGQYTKVIDRKIRELSIRSEILPLGASADQLQPFDAVILSGGPESVYAAGAPKFDPAAMRVGKPVLGICYGMQLLAQFFGGEVSPGMSGEYGVETAEIVTDSALYRGLPRRQQVLMSHGDRVTRVPDGFVTSAYSGSIIASMEDPVRRVYGVQFHPEVDLTEHGQAIFRNFIDEVCGLPHNYVLEDRIASAEAAIRRQVGDSDVVVLVSGGVDSAVSAMLLVRALGAEKVHALHVDHGLMRKNESDEICQTLTRLGLRNLVRIDAAETFFSSTTTDASGKVIGPLTRLQNSEEKRVLIGNGFIQVLNSHIASMGLDPDTTFFAQGTLRPDLIESGNPGVSAIAHKIKTHHNDVELVRRARDRGHVVETNADWHKDEVRRVARSLGLPAEIADRQPFPGPGLALRLMTYDGQTAVTESDAAKLTELLRGCTVQGVTGSVVPIRTVGVQGDFRTYRYLAILSGQAERWTDIQAASQRVTNSHGNVNRVAWVLNGPRDCTQIRAHECWLNPDNVGLVREVDALVRERLASVPLSQVLTILVPVGISKPQSIAIRTFITNDFMTGRFALPGADLEVGLLQQLAAEIHRTFRAIDLVLYDVTSKPPATVEWQ